MTWPKLWSSSTKDDTKSKEPSKTSEAIESVSQAIDAASTSIQRQTNEVLHSNASVFTQPQTILATVVLTTASLGLFKFYKTYLRRIPQAININPSFLRRRSLVGKVTSVGDGDNFRIYHTPGGRLAGWGWFPGRRIPVDKKELKDQTIHVRLAAIDAPELAHFGRPSQPYGQEALEWLTSYVLGKRVRIYVYKADQYSRVVGSAYVWKGLWRRDVSMQMLKAGLATIYEAKSGVEFGKGDEQRYRKAEWWAKTRGKGMWTGKNKDFESPRDYKTRHGVGNPQQEAK